MAVSVVMPALEMAQETGKLISWKKKEGEKVLKGEMLLEVETDKAVVEIEAQAEGILGGVTAQVGDVVPVGQTIAWLLKAGEQAPTTTAPTQTGQGRSDGRSFGLRSGGRRDAGRSGATVAKSATFGQGTRRRRESTPGFGA
jgi:pyruvate/2-oxoglutarate dehydrogenase complex dihydrolipoamide acyltransferase (E2) component